MTMTWLRDLRPSISVSSWDTMRRSTSPCKQTMVSWKAAVASPSSGIQTIRCIQQNKQQLPIQLLNTPTCVFSRLGAMESISSMKMMAGEFFSASSNALRRLDSDSPAGERGREGAGACLQLQ